MSVYKQLKIRYQKSTYCHYCPRYFHYVVLMQSKQFLWIVNLLYYNWTLGKLGKQMVQCMYFWILLSSYALIIIFEKPAFLQSHVGQLSRGWKGLDIISSTLFFFFVGGMDRNCIWIVDDKEYVGTHFLLECDLYKT